MTREEQIIKERERKLEDLRKQGVEPYAYKFDKKNSCAGLQEKYSKLKAGKETKDSVKVAGRVMVVRNMGKISFSILQDFSGKIQIVLQDKKTPFREIKFFQKFIDTGDFIGLEGKIFRTKRGELSILAKKIILLTKSIKPLPEKWHGLSDKEIRYRKRFLDLIINPKVKEVFLIRTKIIEAMREFLAKEGFIEVETPILQPIYGGASARPFESKLNALNMKIYMRISNEMYLKKLIVGGYEKIFEFSKDFRNEGIDWTHNPEFLQMETMWAYANYEDNIKFNEELVCFIVKKILGKTKIKYQDKEIDFKTPWKRIKFRDIILRETKIDIDKADNFEKLKKEILSKRLKEVNIKNCFHYGALLDELYKRTVRPKITQPTFLTHYPIEMIALAKRNEKDKRKINSFQLLISGMEISKSYDELNDPKEQEKRLSEQINFLKKGDKEAMPMDKDFIQALEYGMPPVSGLGIGIDRVVMLLTDSPSVRDVIFFPFMRPKK